MGMQRLWRAAPGLRPGARSLCCRHWPGIPLSALVAQAGARYSSSRAPPPRGRDRSPAPNRDREQPRSEPRGLQYFVTCHPGLEAAVEQQLREAPIGASNVEVGQAGVSFTAPDLTVGYKCNLWLRSAIRVLVLLAQAPLDTRRAAGDSIYDYTR